MVLPWFKSSKNFGSLKRSSMLYLSSAIPKLTLHSLAHTMFFPNFTQMPLFGISYLLLLPIYHPCFKSQLRHCLQEAHTDPLLTPISYPTPHRANLSASPQGTYISLHQIDVYLSPLICKPLKCS